MSWCEVNCAQTQAAMSRATLHIKLQKQLIHIHRHLKWKLSGQLSGTTRKHTRETWYTTLLFSKQECNDDQAPCCRSFHIPKGYDQQVFTKVTTISAKCMHLRLHKFYEPKTPQILWAQGPINFMSPRPHKLYEPKAPKNLWAQHPTNIVRAQGPINSMNLRPHKLYEPKTLQIVQT